MNKIEDIERLLETSHQRGRRETVPEVEALMAKLRDGTWRRRARRVANLQAVLVVFVVAAASMACMPHPPSDKYHTTSLTATQVSDSSTLNQILTTI